MNACCAVDLAERVHAASEGDAEDREEALVAASARLYAELQAEFRRGFAGEDIEMRHAKKLPHEVWAVEAWITFDEALGVVMKNPHVSQALIDATAAPAGAKAAKLERFVTVASLRWADDHAEALAEICIRNRSRS